MKLSEFKLRYLKLPPLPLVCFGLVAGGLLFALSNVYEQTIISATAKDISCNATEITLSKDIYLNIYCVTKHIKISDTESLLTFAINKGNVNVTCRSHVLGIDNCRVEAIK